MAIVIPLALATAAALAYWCAGFKPTDVDLKLSPIAVLIVAMTFYAAFYLQYFLGSRTADRRVEKAIITSHLVEIEQLVRAAYDEALGRQRGTKAADAARRTILTCLRRSSNTIDLLRDLLVQTHCHRLAQYVDEIRDLHTRLRSVLGDGAVRLQEYCPDEVLAQEYAYRAITRLLNTLVLAVNRQR